MRVAQTMCFVVLAVSAGVAADDLLSILRRFQDLKIRTGGREAGVAKAIPAGGQHVSDKPR